MNEQKTIEEVVAGMVLEDPITVTVCGTTLQVPHPTLGTLIRISAAISKLPTVEKVKEDKGRSTVLAALAALAVADRAMPLAEVLALAILGDGNTERTVTRTVYRQLPGIAGRLGLKRRKTVEFHVDRVEPLAARLASKLGCAALTEAIVDILNKADLGSFFELTDFLAAVNLLRKSTTTASGQSSQGCARPSASHPATSSTTSATPTST